MTVPGGSSKVVTPRIPAPITSCRQRLDILHGDLNPAELFPDGIMGYLSAGTGFGLPVISADFGGCGYTSIFGVDSCPWGPQFDLTITNFYPYPILPILYGEMPTIRGVLPAGGVLSAGFVFGVTAGTGEPPVTITPAFPPPGFRGEFYRIDNPAPLAGGRPFNTGQRAQFWRFPSNFGPGPSTLEPGESMVLSSLITLETTGWAGGSAFTPLGAGAGLTVFALRFG